MLRHVALVRTDVSEELSASIIRVTRIGELRTLAVTSNRHRLLKVLVLSDIELSVVAWIGVAQDRYRWRALVNTVMNLRGP
jgi:hypothetical protein